MHDDTSKACLNLQHYCTNKVCNVTNNHFDVLNKKEKQELPVKQADYERNKVL